MANTTTKAYLESTMYNGGQTPLFIKAAQVEAEVDGVKTDLAAVLTDVYGDINALPTTAKVNELIDTAIAETGHAKFSKVESIPEASAAEDNVLYLVLNSETGHYDIYAKIADADGSYTMERLDDTTVDLTNYIQKVTSAVENDIAALNADGTIKDSGKKAGGETLGVAPDANTLATEAAVKAVTDPLATKAEVTALPKIRTGTEVPSDMKNGDVFIRIISSTEA